jgi:hypothetical protein
MVAAPLATDDLGRHVSPTAGSERRKKQQHSLTSSEMVLRDGADPSARYVQHVDSDKTAGIVGSSAPANSLDRHRQY